MGAYIKIYNDDELYHHGIKGQRWGVRRYQNPDGTLTSEGKARLSEYKKREYKLLDKKYDKKISRLDRKIDKKEKSGKKLGRAVSKRAYLTGRKAIEKLALDQMSYKDMAKEDRAVIRDMTLSALFTVGSVPLRIATGGVTPFVISTSSPSRSKEITRGVRVNKRIRRNPITGKVIIDQYKKGKKS